jgi:hypothetical protein
MQSANLVFPHLLECYTAGNLRERCLLTTNLNWKEVRKMSRYNGPEDNPDPEDNDADGIGDDGMDDPGDGDSDDSESES